MTIIGKPCSNRPLRTSSPWSQDAFDIDLCRVRKIISRINRTRCDCGHGQRQEREDSSEHLCLAQVWNEWIQVLILSLWRQVCKETTPGEIRQDVTVVTVTQISRVNKSNHPSWRRRRGLLYSMTLSYIVRACTISGSKHALFKVWKLRSQAISRILILRGFAEGEDVGTSSYSPHGELMECGAVMHSYIYIIIYVHHSGATIDTRRVDVSGGSGSWDFNFNDLIEARWSLKFSSDMWIAPVERKV